LTLTRYFGIISPYAYIGGFVVSTYSLLPEEDKEKRRKANKEYKARKMRDEVLPSKLNKSRYKPETYAAIKQRKRDITAKGISDIAQGIESKEAALVRKDRARAKAYDDKNKEAKALRVRLAREANLEKIKAREKAYKAANRAKINEADRARRKDPVCRLAGNVRARLKAALLGRSKSKKTMELLGCSTEALKRHLEGQFQEGMSWSNYGTDWHMDHIVPLSRFDLTDPNILGKLAHYSNLQPLWVAENIRKGNKLPTELAGG
jgi:5-methylcytosine-specific restriction endonuclease McrA